MFDISKIPKSSWISKKLSLRPSRLHGSGVFSSENLKQHEKIIRWGGSVFAIDDIRNGKARQHTNVGISETLLLGMHPDQELTIDDYMNHSCAPNVSMTDPITIVARTDIEAGVELVADYAMWLNDPSYMMKVSCNCQSSQCRHRITGNDWSLNSFIQENYGHASPFINERIRKLKGWKNESTNYGW